MTAEFHDSPSWMLFQRTQTQWPDWKTGLDLQPGLDIKSIWSEYGVSANIDREHSLSLKHALRPKHNLINLLLKGLDPITTTISATLKRNTLMRSISNNVCISKILIAAAWLLQSYKSFFFFFFPFLFIAAPAAYGISWARDLIPAVATWDLCHTYAAASGNARHLTH